MIDAESHERALDALLRDYATQRGITLIETRKAVTTALEARRWRRDELTEVGEAARRQIESWPKWKRDAVSAHLNQPFVEQPDRGIDGNARW